MLLVFPDGDILRLKDGQVIDFPIPLGSRIYVSDRPSDLEDRLDLNDARAAIAANEGQDSIPWETLKTELDL